MKLAALILSLCAALWGADTPDVARLPAARVFANAKTGELVIELDPIDLPAGGEHHALRQPPVATALLPTAGSIYGLRVEVIDEQGRQLPVTLVHHFNLIDPARRELFLPIARRMAAAGSETGAPKLPWPSMCSSPAAVPGPRKMRALSVVNSMPRSWKTWTWPKRSSTCGSTPID